MRLLLVPFGLLALGSLAGCDADAPKEWSRPRPAAAATLTATAAPKPTVAATATATARPTPPTPAGESWGGGAIAWRTPDDGLAEAKRDGRPVLLVLYTSWCPHCKNYSKLFTDERIVTASKQFVMIRANSDEASDFADRYAPDGGYIPRTFFLKPDGSLLSEVRASDGQYKYFYDEKDPAPLLAAMDRAKKTIAQ
jgi:thiol:disulfide interchange protein